MPAYEVGAFDPPAPVARSIVVGPTGSTCEAPFLIDSGADVSVIPAWVANQVGAELLAEPVALRSFDDSEAQFAVASLRLQLLRYTFQGAFVIAASDHGILGRNILNQLVLTLDGPQQRWSA